MLLELEPDLELALERCEWTRSDLVQQTLSTLSLPSLLSRTHDERDRSDPWTPLRCTLTSLWWLEISPVGEEEDGIRFVSFFPLFRRVVRPRELTFFSLILLPHSLRETVQVLLPTTTTVLEALSVQALLLNSSPTSAQIQPTHLSQHNQGRSITQTSSTGTVVTRFLCLLLFSIFPLHLKLPLLELSTVFVRSLARRSLCFLFPRLLHSAYPTFLCSAVFTLTDIYNAHASSLNVEYRKSRGRAGSKDTAEEREDSKTASDFGGTFPTITPSLFLQSLPFSLPPLLAPTGHPLSFLSWPHSNVESDGCSLFFASFDGCRLVSTFNSLPFRHSLARNAQQRTQGEDLSSR